jgi:hypothetical protein
VTRSLFLVHRWIGTCLGVAAFGVLFSGIFLHWYVFIKPTDEDLLRAYGAPLLGSELPPGIRLPSAGPGGVPIRSASLRHLADRLVWELDLANGVSTLVDAGTGVRRGPISPLDASQLAASVVGANPQDGKEELLNEYDAVYYEGDPPLPAFRVSFRRPRRVDVYLDAATGNVMAVVGWRERITLILGAELHYLKFGPLRLTKYTTLRFVIMGALATAVLASGISGLFYGVPLLLQKRLKWIQGRFLHRSTLVRAAHHCLGVLAGVFIVGWGLSSYMMLWRPSMDPSPAETAQVEGGFVDPDAYRIRVPEALAMASAGGHASVYALRAQRLAGRPVFEAYQAGGLSTLVDGVTGRVLSPISDSLVRVIVAHYLGASAVIRRVTYLDHHDAYYRGNPYGRGYSFDGHRLPLPVYRVDLVTTALPSPLYIDVFRGHLTARVDGSFRVFRWLGSAIHNFDFPALLERPRLWDLVVVIPALLGVLLSGSGLWLGFSHVIRTKRLRHTTADRTQGIDRPSVSEVKP